MKKGLFNSLVSPFANPDGISVAYPGKPYYNGPEIILKPGTEPIELDMVFMTYTKSKRKEPLLEFIKEIGKNESKRAIVEKIKPISDDSEIVVKPPVKTDEIEVDTETLESDKVVLESQIKRNKTESDKELQDIAYNLPAVRESVGFSNLRERKTTIEMIYNFITNKRKLYTNYTGNSATMPRKNEWISIALHGFTDKPDKDNFQYDTRKWCKKWYKTERLKELFKSKGLEYPKGKLDQVFQIAWDKGWFKRDPMDIMDGVEF